MVWVKVDDRFDEHPKVAQVGPLGVALWVTGLAYCNRNLTDGFIPRAVAKTLIDWTITDGDGVEWGIGLVGGDGLVGSHEPVESDLVIDHLVAAGMWEKVKGGYLVHDFGDYQPTRAEIEADRAQKQAAGRAGGLASAWARGRASGQANGQAESKPVPVPVPVSRTPVPDPSGAEAPAEAPAEPPASLMGFRPRKPRLTAEQEEGAALARKLNREWIAAGMPRNPDGTPALPKGETP